jgi:hypothetical protein
MVTSPQKTNAKLSHSFWNNSLYHFRFRNRLLLISGNGNACFASSPLRSGCHNVSILSCGQSSNVCSPFRRLGICLQHSHLEDSLTWLTLLKVVGFQTKTQPMGSMNFLNCQDLRSMQNTHTWGTP